MNKNSNFGYLGYNFQIKLLNQIITDKKYCQSIIDVIDAKYFDNQYFKIIAQIPLLYTDFSFVEPLNTIFLYLKTSSS